MASLVLTDSSQLTTLKSYQTKLCIPMPNQMICKNTCLAAVASDGQNLGDPTDKGDPEFIKRQEQKKSDLDEQLKEYIAEWRKQRSKEEDELKRLKEKQSKRKVMRADEEKRMAERKKQEEERRQREVEEKKQRDIEEKRRRLEEAEKKRQAMMASLKDQTNKNKGPNFTITKKDQGFNLSSAQIERNKTKEQLEEEKKISLSFRIKPLDIENLSLEKLRTKAQELWEAIIKLETEKYDLEERQKRQDYDVSATSTIGGTSKFSSSLLE
uniref:Troponin T n=1 Tax=Timema shepardi TaxID=629360 RepID=A0A7R9B0G4_TIMSH|nr:unnamed protein product [Timema shepardi]